MHQVQAYAQKTGKKAVKIEKKKQIKYPVTEAITSAQGVYLAILSSDKIFIGFLESLNDTLSEMPSWDGRQWGEFSGDLTAEILSVLAPVGIGKKALDTVKISKGVDKAGDFFSGKTRKLLDSAQKVKPKLGNKYVRELPDLDGSLKEAFDGHIFKGT